MFDAMTAEVAAVRAAVSAAVDADPPRDDTALLADADALLSAVAQLQALAAERLSHVAARDATDLEGYSSVTSWAAARPGANPAEAATLLGLAQAAHRHPATARVWRAGRLSSAHLRLVQRATRGLEPELREAGDAFFAEVAPDLSVRELHGIAEAWRDTVTPEVAATERDALVEEQAAQVSPTGGALLVRAVLAGRNAAFFQAAVDRFSRPRPHDARTAAQRRADALGDIARLATAADDAARAGEPMPLPPVRVTVLADPLSLQRALDARDGRPRRLPGWLPSLPRELSRPAADERTGAALSTAELMAALCDGPLGRALLDAEGEALDVGRSLRLFTGAQRRALAGGGAVTCQWRRCDSPWVEAHHHLAWSDGGATDLGNGRLLCGYHHSLVHLGWQLGEGGRALAPPDWVARRWSRSRKRHAERAAVPGVAPP